MASFGLGYDELAAVHPGVIYVSVSGFGASDSPYADWPAYSSIVEAMSGIYEYTRRPDESPRANPVGALGDIAAALFASIGILAALRWRDATGQGQHVDIAMFDATVAMTDIVTNLASLGQERMPLQQLGLYAHARPVQAGRRPLPGAGEADLTWTRPSPATSRRLTGGRYSSNIRYIGGGRPLATSCTTSCSGATSRRPWIRGGREDRRHRAALEAVAVHPGQGRGQPIRRRRRGHRVGAQFTVLEGAPSCSCPSMIGPGRRSTSSTPATGTGHARFETVGDIFKWIGVR